MLATVATFRDPWTAHLLRMRLEVEGVPAFVAFQYHIGNDWLYSTALGGAHVQVWRRQAKDAKEIMEACRAGKYRAQLAEEVGDLDDPRCPHCGSERYSRRRSISMYILFFVALPLTLLPAWGWVYICRNCGTKFCE